MTAENQSPESSPKSTSGQPKSSSRRRLLQAGLGASPAILTLVSSPVRATYYTTPASSFASINTSRPHGGQHPTNGCKPSWWVNCAMSGWPASCKDLNNNPKKFKDCFSDYGTYGNKTLKECMQLASDIGTDGVVKHLCAAYLNAASGKTPAAVCSTDIAKDIWACYSAGQGYYEPSAGVRWYADSCDPAGNGGITPWLKTTMPYG